MKPSDPLPDCLLPLEFTVPPFPEAAVTATIARREECIPHLLHAIEWADAHPDEANNARPPYTLHLFALHLLAQFRETRALPLVVRLFRNPQYENLTGDVATESLPNILGSLCGDDIAPIKVLIEDPEVDEWVRGAAVITLGVLLRKGIRPRNEISAYFGELFGGRLSRNPHHVWNCLIGVCTDFGMVEHLEAIRTLYNEGIADPYYESLKSVEHGIVCPLESSRRKEQADYSLINDTIEEMRDWSCFDSGNSDVDGFIPSQRLATPVRTEPKIGRNDPCPCNSGKKYKKCCGK